jgi:hypothetical protein
MSTTWTQSIARGRLHAAAARGYRQAGPVPITNSGVGGSVLYAPPGSHGIDQARLRADPCRMPAQATLPGAGSWHDADRSVTARRSLLSWSQTVAEPGHGRARGAAVRRGRGDRVKGNRRRYRSRQSVLTCGDALRGSRLEGRVGILRPPSASGPAASCARDRARDWRSMSASSGRRLPAAPQLFALPRLLAAEMMHDLRPMEAAADVSGQRTERPGRRTRRCAARRCDRDPDPGYRSTCSSRRSRHPAEPTQRSG